MTTPSEAPSRRVEMLTQWIIDRMVLMGEQATIHLPWQVEKLGGQNNYFHSLKDEQWRELADALRARLWDVRLHEEPRGVVYGFGSVHWKFSLLVRYPEKK